MTFENVKHGQSFIFKHKADTVYMLVMGSYSGTKFLLNIKNKYLYPVKEEMYRLEITLLD